MTDTVIKKPLPRPVSGNTADQCREMGLKVGDVIEGKEAFEDSYHIVRLQLVWLGTETAVFLSQECTNEHPDWSEPSEGADWILDCRDWFLLEPSEETKLAAMKAEALQKLREAEKAMHAYFVACPMGQERNRASEVYDNIRHATRV